MHIIASGQEELIRRMVAPPLPPGWEFAGARIEGATVVARYGRASDRAVAVMTSISTVALITPRGVPT